MRRRAFLAGMFVAVGVVLVPAAAGALHRPNHGKSRTTTTTSTTTTVDADPSTYSDTFSDTY